jgi:hypothetical protein
MGSNTTTSGSQRAVGVILKRWKHGGTYTHAQWLLGSPLSGGHISLQQQQQSRGVQIHAERTLTANTHPRSERNTGSRPVKCTACIINPMVDAK